MVRAIRSDRKVKNGRTYAEQLYFELYQIAGDFFDDLQGWLLAAYEWIIENWQTVLKVALTLIMLLI